MAAVERAFSFEIGLDFGFHCLIQILGIRCKGQGIVEVVVGSGLDNWLRVWASDAKAKAVLGLMSAWASIFWLESGQDAVQLLQRVKKTELSNKTTKIS